MRICQMKWLRKGRCNIYPILLGLKEFIINDNIIFGRFQNSKGGSYGKSQINDEIMNDKL